MNVGIIGVGDQARRVHLPTLESIEEVEVVGIADINEKRAKFVSTKFKIPEIYTNYYDLLNNESIELVLICTPPYLNKKIAVDCFLAGKHVLVEKPMATNVKDADEMIKVAEENNVKLCVIQNYRFFSSVNDSKNIIKNGRIGEIVSIGAHMLGFPPSGSTEWRFTQKSEGVIEDIGPHLIDIVLYLNDSDIEQVYAIGDNIGGNIDVIDHAQIMIKFKDRSLATLDLSWVSGTKEISLYVQGTAGLLHIDVRNEYVQEIHQYATPLDEVRDTIKKVNKIGRGVISGDYFVGPKKFHREIITKFIESIKGNTRPPVTWEEGRKTVFVMESALKCIRRDLDRQEK